MIGQLGQTLVSVADSIMVGKFLGTIPLAAISLAVSILIIPMVFAIGVAYGLTPLVAGADGKEDPAEAVKYFKNGLVLNSILGLLVYGVLALFAQFAHLLGQDVRVVEASLPYIHLVGLSIVPMMSFFAFKQFAEGLSDTKAGMRVSLVANLLNILLNYPLITGWGPFPELGLAGAALATLSTRFLMLGGMALYIRKHKKFESYWRYWRSSQISWKSIRDILVIGVPSGLQYVFEAGAFAMSGVIVGMIGPVQQAAHQIALNIASVSYMMCLFIGFRNLAPEFYSSDPEVLQYTAVLMIAAGIFQLPDGLQATTLGALRGVQDVNVPTIIAFISYWVVAVPLCYYLGVVMAIGPLGVWIGLAIGLLLAAIALYWRFQYKVRSLL